MQKLGWFGGVKGQPRSSKTSPFDRTHMTSYSTLIAINDKNYSLSIVLTAMDQKLRFDTIHRRVTDTHTHTHTDRQTDTRRRHIPR